MTRHPSLKQLNHWRAQLSCEKGEPVMNRFAAKKLFRGCTVLVLSTLTVSAWAQTRQVEVKRAKVVYVSGNDLVVKAEDGKVRHFVVPADFKFTVDGKQVATSDLTPGTELTQTITTTSEEKVVTNVRTVDAKVVEARPPYLTLVTGDTTKHFKVPEGTKFTVNGKEMKLTDLREGMRLKGTVVSTTPTTVVSRTRNVTGQSASVDTPAIIGVILFEEVDVP